MPLLLCLNVPADFDKATVFTLPKKLYQEKPLFWEACDVKAVLFIYENQEYEHKQLMQVLDSIPKKYRSLPFASWIKHNTPVHTLTKKAQKCCGIID